MNFDWSLYLRLARELGGRADDASKRTAISRAYYYAFHVANDHLKAHRVLLNPTKGAHERVWDIFIKSSRRECIKIGTDGYRLKAARREADYTADRNPSDRLVQRSIQEAENIVRDVPLYLPETASGNALQAPERFEKATRLLTEDHIQDRASQSGLSLGPNQTDAIESPPP